MLFGLAIVAGCGPAEGRVGGFWPTKRRAVPSAPGVGLDTPPQNGCCRAPLVNAFVRRELAKHQCSRKIRGALR